MLVAPIVEQTTVAHVPLVLQAKVVSKIGGLALPLIHANKVLIVPIMAWTTVANAQLVLLVKTANKTSDLASHLTHVRMEGIANPGVVDLVAHVREDLRGKHAKNLV